MKIKAKHLQDTFTSESSLKASTHRSEKHYPQFEVRTGAELDRHLRELIDLEENGDLFFSIYLDLTGTQAAEAHLRELVRSILPSLTEDAVEQLFQAESYILDIIGERLRNQHKGLAIHYRGGREETLHVIAFHLPVKPAIFADQSPNLLELIEMRDSYDRYVVLISTEGSARIMEIVLGTVTREAWLSRPNLRKRLRGEWSVEHYRNHRHEQSLQFIKEKISILKQLFRKGGYSHLILAGNSERIAQIEKHLPPELSKKIVDICNLQVSDPREKVVHETIQLFVEQESFESRSNLERLEQTILTGGGGVTGLDRCEKALAHGVIETLIMTKSSTRHSRKIRTFSHRNTEGNYLTLEKRRQRLIERAIQADLRIEFVESGTFLDDYCGVGAILRYRGAEHATV